MYKLKTIREFIADKGIYIFLHVSVLIMSLILIYSISRDTLEGIAFYEHSRFMHLQFWICVGFMADFFIELFLAKKKWYYLKTRIIFFVVAIPYQAILYKFNLIYNVPEQLLYLLRYMPLIRGGFTLAIVVSWLTYSKVAGLFFTYIIILVSTVYFASLTFFLFEHGSNPTVTTYHDALWWATMDVTTVGSNITAVTTVGRVLSVVLAAMGMMMFPIFTVYITNIVTRHNHEGESNNNMILIPKELVKKVEETDTDNTSSRS